MIVKKLIESNDPDAGLLGGEQKYTVYSVLLGDQIKLLVEDGDIFSFPFFIPASEVEIIDGTLSKYWKYSGPVASDQRYSSRAAMLACEEMLHDRLFYQRLVDGDSDAKKEWQLIKNQMDAELFDVPVSPPVPERI